MTPVRFVRIAGATEHEADDAVQNAFAQFLQATSMIRDPRSWLYKVAFNDFRKFTLRVRSRWFNVIETPTPPQEISEGTTSMPSAADAAALNEEN